MNLVFGLQGDKCAKVKCRYGKKIYLSTQSCRLTLSENCSLQPERMATNKAQPLCSGPSYNKVHLMRFIYRESGGKEREMQWGGRENGWQNELNLEEAGNKLNV